MAGEVYTCPALEGGLQGLHPMLETKVVGCCFGIPFGCGTLLLLAASVVLWAVAGKLDWLPL